MTHEKITHLDLFSGIGGFALAADRAWTQGGVRHIFCDNDAFARAVLHKHWPDSPIHEDIRKLDGASLGPIDLVTGGFPCQPFSTAGKRKGTDDDRHLWPEMLRVIREAHPRWVIAENVDGLLTWDRGLVLEGVLADLEAAGYAAWPLVIPACAVNAPHKRYRVWIVANAVGGDAGGAPGADARASAAQGVRQRDAVEQPSKPDTLWVPADASSARRRKRHKDGGGLRQGEGAVGSQERRGPADRSSHSAWEEVWPAAVARLCAMDDGLPGGLARPRGWRNAALKGAGNAIVPQVAEEIMRAMDL